MSKRLTREEVIDLVTNIIECNGTEEEIDEMIEILKSNVLDPEVINLIFWNDEDLTSEQIVDRALSYKPILL